jgi:hypothetical protein
MDRAGEESFSASPKPLTTALVGNYSDDLSSFGVTPQLRLLVHRRAVHGDLETPAARGDELHLRGRELLFDLGRQTGGAWFVVSNGAVFDRDLHKVLKSRRSGK